MGRRIVPTFRFPLLLLGLLNTEDGSDRFHRNVVECLPNYKLVRLHRTHASVYATLLFITSRLINFPEQILENMNYTRAAPPCIFVSCNIGNYVGGLISEYLNSLSLCEFQCGFITEP
jgi:hypothetical protein